MTKDQMSSNVQMSKVVGIEASRTRLLKSQLFNSFSISLEARYIYCT